MSINMQIQDALFSAQAVLNPTSGFLKKGDKGSRAYLEEVRIKIRAALAITRR